jgi:hypothetical protein
MASRKCGLLLVLVSNGGSGFLMRRAASSVFIESRCLTFVSFVIWTLPTTLGCTSYPVSRSCCLASGALSTWKPPVTDGIAYLQVFCRIGFYSKLDSECRELVSLLLDLLPKMTDPIRSTEVISVLFCLIVGHLFQGLGLDVVSGNKVKGKKPWCSHIWAGTLGPLKVLVEEYIGVTNHVLCHSCSIWWSTTAFASS